MFRGEREPKRMPSVLMRCYAYDAFRSYQKEAVDQVLAGKDCLVFNSLWPPEVINPCDHNSYWIPLLVSNKTALVVSPLSSLIKIRTSPTHILKGHVESVVQLKRLDIQTVKQHYKV